MANSLLPVERTISGKGIIKIPDDFRKAKRITLFTQILRPVETPSVNLSFNPDKSFYAHITFCKDKYVLQTYDVNFEQQMYAVWENQIGQNLLALKCGIRQLLKGDDSLIDGFNYNTFIADTLLFECFATTSIKLTLEGEEMQVCEPSDNTPTPTPPIPPPVPKVLPDAPIEVTPPYPDDPGQADTDPVPQDNFPPQLTECLRSVLTYTLTSAEFPTPGLTASIDFFGEFERIDEQPGSTSTQVNVRVIGGETVGNQCLQGKVYPIVDNVSLPYTLQIVSIVPV